MTKNIKNKFIEFIKSLPAGIPTVGSVYSHYLSNFSSEEQKEFLKLIVVEEKKQSDFFRENTKKIKIIKSQLERIVEVGEKSYKITKKVHKNTEEIKKMLNERNKTILEKFKKRDIAKEDIIEGLCSSDIKLKIYATYYVGEYKFKDTARFLTNNLKLPYEELKKITLSTLSRLSIKETFNDVVKYVHDQNKELASLAKDCINFLDSDVVNQSNFDIFLSWITGEDKDLKRISLEFLYILHEKGKLDASSIKDELLYVFQNETDSWILEITIRILGQIEDITKEIDLIKIIYNEKDHEKNKFVKSASCHTLFLDKKYEELYKYFNYLIENNIEDGLHLQNIAEYCVNPGNPLSNKAKQLIEKYLEKKEKEGKPLFIDLYSLYSRSNRKIERISLKPNALGKNKIEMDCKSLQKNKEFNIIIEILLKKGYGMPFLIIYDEESRYGLENITFFLNKEYGFYTIDFRNKDRIFIEKIGELFKNKQKIVVIYSKDLENDLNCMISWISEYNTINFRAMHPHSNEIKLGKFSRIIILMDSRDYELINKDKPNFFLKYTPISYSFIDK